MTIDQTFKDKKKEYKKLNKQLLKILSNSLDKTKLEKNTINKLEKKRSKLRSPQSRINNSFKSIDHAHKSIDILLEGTNSAVEISKKINEIYSSLTDDEKKNLDEEVQSKK